MADTPPSLAIPLDAAETKLRRAYWLLIATGYMKSAMSLIAIVVVLCAVVITPPFFIMFFAEIGARPAMTSVNQFAQYLTILVVAALLCAPAVGVYFLDRVTRGFSSAAGIVWSVVGGISLLAGLMPNSPIWFLFLRDDLNRVLMTRDIDEIITLLLALSVLLQFYLIWLVYRGIRAYFDAAPEERRILSEPAQGATRIGRILIRYLGLPPTLDFVRRPRRRFVALVAMAFLQALSLAAAAILAITAPSAWLFRPIFCQSLKCKVDAIDLFLPFVLAPPLFILFVVAGIAAQRVVQRLVRLSLSELQTRDPRPPILYLRSFQDDGAALPVPRLPLPPKLLDYGRRDLRLEHVLLEEGTPYGPVVALGDPNEKLPAYGAAKGYFDNARWRDAVAKIAADARAAVIALNVTESIWWEVAHLVTSGYLDKTLFLLRPVDAEPTANAAMRARLVETIGPASNAALPLDGNAAAPVIAVYRGSDGRLRLLTSRTFSRFAYVLALRQFLREKFDAERPPAPSPPPVPSVPIPTAA